ncbi:TetR/AcrR family transcriptional regulator [Mycolicibacterium smegmatis]|uniref:Transcriptional regulator, TetR family n=8 Tax=Mycolicibacterium smegmatis TaxID=1772 RepID=I7G5D3_MYCS2|nr:TetR/AcrR family transcriptional regulator [Mycolicibacterium smegmatis]ABK73047.1 transcriptional regulator [Mycolicibacterium smegmatis MC2 155]AFP37814.1 Transcriptional regulator, TetR family [Mycolicibacterium smegmatis MC2 155]AIU06619.1 transcriptional regulator [Mycolicibacterium smegmatis MC2 155]AIU13244.1 transcriptional regulator [Mycolicibacterium smegmatis]AIU19868.1 transcriptional regulator [Mycolicibacterium smegmatis]
MSAPETPERPLRKDAERNRKRVLEAARELFAAKGLEPNLNDVARHAGVGVGTVYRRFATKEELLEAIFEDAMNQLTDLAEEALRKSDSWQGFAWFVEQQCQLTVTDRGLREIAFSKCYGGDRVKAAQDRLSVVTTELVERAQRDGHLRPGVSATDLPLLALLAGTVTEFAGHVDADLWRRYTSILLEGMRHHPGQEPVAVFALDRPALEAAMRTWEPAGPPSHRPRPPCPPCAT